MPEGTTRRIGRTSKWLEDNPSNPTDPYSNTVATIASLRASISTGGQISFNDINSIRNLLTLVKDHTHTYQDYQAIQDFGNSFPPGTIGPTVRTTTVGFNPSGSSFTSASGGIGYLEAAGNWVGINFQPGGIIYAADFNTLRTSYTRIRQHFHRLPEDFYYTSRTG
jgi:hypothetical protein